MKILICNNFKLENKGGPSGYLFNLTKFKSGKINYLNNFVEEKKKKERKNIKNRLRKYNLLFEILKLFKVIIKINLEKMGRIKLKNYEEKDILHYHSTLEFYKSRYFLKNIKKIKVLTSHSPQPTSEEIVESMNLKNKYLSKILYFLIKKIDIYAFKNSDYIIFPCKEAMEPYLTRDIKINKILENKILENKIKFLPTGIIDKKIEYQKDYFYNKFNIPKNAIILSYLGRHNEIKGYDLLIEAGKEILKNNSNVYIIVAGKLNENKPHLIHERWIELGWTTEGDNILKHAHAYLLPNRETYFDLVFIEALRAGGTIICSETGGNKYFKKFKSSDIIYFEKENIKQLIEVIENNLEKFSAKNYIKNRKENRKIYEENFTVDKFGKKYIEIMEKIYEEGK